MPNLGFIPHAITEPDEKRARDTKDPVRTDGDIQPTANEWNTARTDGSDQLRGIGPHRVPGRSTENLPAVTTVADIDYRSLDRTRAARGYAPTRELTTGYGAGTMRIYEDVEPTIRPGSTLGNTHLVIPRDGINEASLGPNGVGATPISDMMQVAARRTADRRKDALRSANADWWR